MAEVEFSYVFRYFMSKCTFERGEARYDVAYTLFYE